MNEDLEDQVTQDQQEQARRPWRELSELEQAAALRAMTDHLNALRRSADTIGPAVASAWILARRLDPEYRAPSPVSVIAWQELSEQELAEQLLEVGEWAEREQAFDRDLGYQLNTGCQDAAEMLERKRRRSRGERDR